MAFDVVLDTSVLYPASLRDALLRLAVPELYQPRWSPSILDELCDVLQRNGITEAKAQRLVNVMCEAFPEAHVDQQAVDALVWCWTPETSIGQAMAGDLDDRHVLAAAVVAGAENVVTENLPDFPKAACSPFGVEAVAADTFLCNLFHLSPSQATEIIQEQAAALQYPPMSVDEVLDNLAETAPIFSGYVRGRLAFPGG